MEQLPSFSRLLLLIIPIILIQIGLQVFALIDLSRAGKVRWDNKWIWVAIIIIGEIFGPIIYFLAGKREE